MFEINDQTKKIIFIGLTVLLFILFIANNNSQPKIEATKIKQTAPSCCGNSNSHKRLKDIYQEEEENKVKINDDDIVIMNFNTDWCFYSKKFQPIWDEFTQKMEGKDIIIKDVKCDQSHNEELCSKYKVEGFPTVKLVKNKKVYEFKGRRTVQDLTNFVNEHIN